MGIRKDYKYVKLDWVEKRRYIINKYGNVYDNKTNSLVHVALNGNGYAYVCLKDITRDKHTSISLHRLLALTFLPKTSEDISLNREYVHFKDFDKENIIVDNLEWVNPFELNMLVQYRYNHDEENIKEYLTPIDRCIDRGYSSKDICKLIGLNKRCSSLITKHRKKKSKK